LIAVGIYGNNKLWEGHRVLLPEFREKATGKCRECRYYVLIEGKEEVRSGCIEKFKDLWYGNPPEKIHVREVLKAVGREGLGEIVSRGNPNALACGYFRRKLHGKPVSTFRQKL
jgi:hypothetical protein